MEQLLGLFLTVALFSASWDMLGSWLFASSGDSFGGDE